MFLEGVSNGPLQICNWECTNGTNLVPFGHSTSPGYWGGWNTVAWRVCVTTRSAWRRPGCTRCRTAAGPIALPGRPAQTSWTTSLRLTANYHLSRTSPPETHLYTRDSSAKHNFCFTGIAAQQAWRVCIHQTSIYCKTSRPCFWIIISTHLCVFISY